MTSGSEKKLTPLRIKDREAGRREERKAVIAWLESRNLKWTALEIASGDHVK